VSIKVHYLLSPLDRFPANFGEQNQEHGEWFHQDIVLEEMYQGRWDAHRMADYCWSLLRDCLAASHSRVLQKKICKHRVIFLY